MQFKKSDSKEIQRTMAIVLLIILVGLQAAIGGGFYDIIDYSYVTPPEIFMYAMGLILWLFVIMFLIKKENIYFSILDLLVILSIISLMLSTFFAQDVTLALNGNTFAYEGAVMYLVYFVVFFACSCIEEKKYRKIVYSGIILAGLVESFWGFMQSIVKMDFFLLDYSYEEGDTVRAFGMMLNQNPYGALMGLLSALEIGLSVSSKGKRRILHTILAVIFVITLMLSGTRAGMVGLAAAVLVLAIFLLVSSWNEKERRRRLLKVYGIMLAVLVVCAAAIEIISGGLVSETITRTFAELVNVIKTGDVDSLFSGRVGIWKGALNKVKVYPLLGIGVANLCLIRVSEEYIATAYVAHNQYIEILATEGILGLVAHLLLMIYVLVQGYKRIKKSGSMEKLGLWLAVIAFLVTDIFGWRNMTLTVYFYAVLGLLASRKDSLRLLGAGKNKQ